MTETTIATTKKQDKRYNVTGIISKLVTGSMKSGLPFVNLALVRDGKKALNCAGFDKKASDLLASFADGSTVKLFGFYETRSFTNAEGATVATKRFKILSSAVPTVKVEAVAEAVAA
jgi:hypothetical protein